MTVIEIIPRDMTWSPTSHKWIGFLTALVGGDWQPYFCENTESDDKMPEVGGLRRAGYLPFDLDIGAFMSFIP